MQFSGPLYFSNDNIILHTAEICRNKNKFLCLKDKGFREFFYQELNNLMNRLQYKVVACVIHKNKHLDSYGFAALDPYILSLNILLERFGYELSKGNQGVVVAESRNIVLDNQLKIAWENLKIQGTRHFKAKYLKKRICDFKLENKKNNIAGLQLADLVVSPIGRYIIGKKVQEDFQIIKQKFRKNDKGIYDGYGLVVLPK